MRLDEKLLDLILNYACIQAMNVWYDAKTKLARHPDNSILKGIEKKRWEEYTQITELLRDFRREH